MKTLGLAIAALAFAGCAATAPQSAAPKSFAPGSAATTTTTISSADLDQSLTDYDQLVSRRLDGTAKTRLNVCVSPSGKVSKAAVVAGSGIDELDRAIASAITNWKYERATAAVTEDRCRNVSVVYQTQI